MWFILVEGGSRGRWQFLGFLFCLNLKGGAVYFMHAKCKETTKWTKGWKEWDKQKVLDEQENNPSLWIEGNGNPLQHSCLGNPMDRGAWRATEHGSHGLSD